MQEFYLGLLSIFKHITTRSACTGGFLREMVDSTSKRIWRRIVVFFLRVETLFSVNFCFRNGRSVVQELPGVADRATAALIAKVVGHAMTLYIILLEVCYHSPSGKSKSIKFHVCSGTTAC